MSQSRSDVDDDLGGGGEYRRLSRMIKEGRSFSGNERNCCFLNMGSSPKIGGRFATVSAVSGLDLPDDGRGAAAVDWDLDGDLDLWVSNRNAPRVRFFRNVGDHSGGFVSVRLIGNGSTTNRDAVGARVEIVLKGEHSPKLNCTLRAGEGFLSQGSKWMHFGLGDASIQRVTVRWPGQDGVEEFRGVTRNERFVLVQGVGRARRVRPDAEPRAIEPSPGKAANLPGSIRIPLVTRMRVPRLTYLDFDRQERSVQPDARGVLVNLWASWCPPCVEELAEWRDREHDLASARIDVLALSVDSLGDDRGDLDAVTKITRRLNLPFKLGYAQSELLQTLQGLHDILIPLNQRLPIPSSFLIDDQGRLVAIYKGRVDVETVLRDAACDDDTRELRLVRSAPRRGRTVGSELLLASDKQREVLARFHLSSMLEGAGRFSDAEAQVRDLIELEPNLPEAHFNLGILLKKRHSKKEAIESLKAALDLDPSLATASRAVGELLSTSGRPHEALPHFLDAIHDSPEDAGLRQNLGVALAACGQLKLSVVQLRKAVAYAWQDPQIHYNLASVLIGLEETDEALIHLKHALSLNPRYPGAHFAMGAIAEGKGDFANAASAYARAVKNHPKAARAHYRLGLSLERIGEIPLAFEHLRQSNLLDPTQAAMELARIRNRSRFARSIETTKQSEARE